MACLHSINQMLPEAGVWTTGDANGHRLMGVGHAPPLTLSFCDALVFGG